MSDRVYSKKQFLNNNTQKTVSSFPSPPHLLGIESLSTDIIDSILSDASKIVEAGDHRQSNDQTLSGKSVINLFFENSTRTLVSFELAARRLGASVVNIASSTSSIKKGESLLDTALTLNAMSPDFLIVRHPCSGAPALLSQAIDCSIINAGDGSHEHPTQALLDALTILRHKKRLKGLKVLICGDVLHSRVARSNILLLGKMGAEVRIVGPTTLIPQNMFALKDETSFVSPKVFHNLEDAIKDCDIIIVLRLQLERMQGTFVPSVFEYYRFFGLNRAKLAHAKDDALIMHPGPVNRGIEIASDIADDLTRSLISQQVEMGVAVRMACLKFLNQFS